VIEVVSTDRCIGCERCIRACPTDVFDPGADGVPVVARRADCQTCFLCELYCPVDALFVAPQTDPLPVGAPLRDERYLIRAGLLGSYRERVGWGNGRTPAARLAVGPPIEPAGTHPAHRRSGAGRT
jgi:NAD-dependent dihydropyrimidine dehydrogenase PreA subunit